MEYSKATIRNEFLLLDSSEVGMTNYFYPKFEKNHLMHIDHATIRTNYLKETRDFMVSVFDLVEGERPEIIAALVDGYWLYWNESPLIHLIKSPEGTAEVPNNATEAIDHFALIMENYDAFKQKLIAMDIPFKLMDVPEMNIRRIFLHTPYNVLIETIFRD